MRRTRGTGDEMKRKLEAWVVMAENGTMLALRASKESAERMRLGKEALVKMVPHNPDDARVLRLARQLAVAYRASMQMSPYRTDDLVEAVERREKRIKKGAKR